MSIAVIGFASNYQANSNLIKGLKALNQRVSILSISPVYENPAIGKISSPPYLNGVCLVNTNLPPLELHKQVLRPIENSLGRLRGEEGKAKCSLDLDLLLYENEILSTPQLQLPAPDILRYAFVAIPLGFLVPTWIHPVTKETMAQIGNRFVKYKVKFKHQVEVNSAIATAIFPPALSYHQPIPPWHWRKLPLAQLTGSQVFQALFLNPTQQNSNLIKLLPNHFSQENTHQSNISSENLPPASPDQSATNSSLIPASSPFSHQPIATLLESPVTPNNTNLARYSLCAGSPRYINNQPQLWTPPVGEILPFLRRLLNTPKPDLAQSNVPLELPFTGGWLGWLGYDLAWEIEQLPQLKADPLPFPTAYWYEPESFAVLDHQQQILWLASTNPTQLDAMQNQLEQADQGIKRHISESNTNPNPVTPILEMSQSDYIIAVQQAQKYIQSGDIFQANLSLRFAAHTSDQSWSIYQALQEINPSPFASYWQTPWGAIISCSPERLIKLSGMQAQTRPIAGTRSRGATSIQDQQLAQELIANLKERAEHIMLVDLERNDLGKVCEWGTVKVDELLTIERYSHVMHLVSNIIGKLRLNCDPVDLIQAVFPGGTITGCPKVRCMEIIEELEPVKRSLFYGSCGYLDWRGNLDLNILIRTLLYTELSNYTSDAIVWGQVGAGIVADSNPQKEWDESLQKAQAQLHALKLALDK